MVNYREILRLSSLKYTQRQIAASVHSSRNTVSDVIKLTSVGGLSWPLDDSYTNIALYALLYPNRLEAVNPRNVKIQLAQEIVSLYYGHDAGTAAKENFEKVFTKRQLPENIPELEIPSELWETGHADAVKLLVSSGLLSSSSEARRLIAQGGLKLNGVKTGNFVLTEIQDGDIIQAGKLKFLKLRIIQH